MGTDKGQARDRWAWLKTIVQLLIVAVVYVVGARIGLSFAYSNRNVTAFWPPTGIAVAALAAWGLRMWPGVALGALAANLWNGASVGTAAAIMVGNTVAPVIGVAVLQRIRFDTWLTRLRDVIALILIGGVGAMTISALAGTAALLLTGEIGNDSIASVAGVWWVGDAIGVIIFAPFLLLLSRLGQLFHRPIEVIALLVVTAVSAYAVFNVRILIPYLVLAPVVWAALRFGQVGAAMVTVIICATAVAQNALGNGPFTFLSLTQNLVSLQTFNATIATAGLILATMMLERRRAEDRLRTSEEVYRKLFEQANDFVCVHDRDGRITYANAAASRITGYSHERLMSMTIADLVAPEYLRVVRRMMHRQFVNEGQPLTYEVDVIGTDGRRLALEVSSALAHTEADPVGVQLIGRDITSRRQAEEQLRRHALTDELTGLPNETLLRERLAYAISLAEHEGTLGAVLLIDLDRFRLMNEIHGTEQGDRFLQKLGANIGRDLRVTDSVARLRGDEFAVLVTPIKEQAEAANVADQILSDVSFLGGEDGVSASIGIALFPTHAVDADALLRMADIAMHAAKQSGGSTHAFYGAGMDPERMRRLALQSELPSAFGTDDLQVLFQPKIATQDLATVGVDCFAQWRHPRHGPVSGRELGNMAEHADLTQRLAEWMLEHVLERCRVWQDAGLGLTVGLAVSKRELLYPQPSDRLRILLDETGVPPDRLLIEVNERDVTNDAVQPMLRRLTDMGAGISVGHFGTGYTSLVQLGKLPIAEIRIDRSIVQGLATNSDDRTIARSIIELGHNLGVKVVGSGIEARDTWTHLVDLGCDIAQGPLICEPVTASELESWMRTPAWSGRVS
jgi:PAS domain S-box-containing protein/diguanylate cyclase (GGDEF)-like protein